MAAQEFTLQDLVLRVQKAAAQFGVDPQIAVSLLISENTADGTYDPARKVRSDTLSPQGAVGVMQVMPEVFSKLRAQGAIPSSGEISDVDTNIAAAMALIKQQAAQFQSMDPTILAIGYHGGPAAVSAFQTNPVAFKQNNPKTAEYANKATRARLTFAGETGLPTPSVAGFSLAKATQLNNQATAQAQSITQLLESITGQLDANAKAGSAAIQQAGAAGADVVAADTAAARTALLGQQAVTAKTGMDINDPTSFVVQKMQEMAGHAKTVAELTPQLEKARSANPFLNPVGWIMGQLQGQQISAKLDTAKSLMGLAEEEIQHRRALTKDLQTLVPQASMESLAMRERAGIDLKRAQTKLEELKWNNENAGMRVRLAMEPFSLMTNVFNMNASMMRLLADKIGLDAVQGAKEEDQKRLDQANLAMQFITGKNGATFATPKDLATFEANPKNRELMERVRIGGMSPGLYVAAVDQLGNVAQLSKTDPIRGEFTRQLLNSVYAELQRGVKDPTNPAIAKPYKGSEIEQIEAATRNIVARWQEELKAADPSRMSADNPYKMRAGVFAAAPGLENNYFANFVLDQGAKGLKELSEKELFAELQAKTQAFPEMKGALVQDFADFIAQGRAYQQGATGLGMIGMPADPRVGYKYQLKGPGLFSAAKVVDLQNPVEVEHGLVGTLMEDPGRAQSAQRAAREAMKQRILASDPNGGTQQ